MVLDFFFFGLKVRLSLHLTLATFPLKREEERALTVDELPLAMSVCVSSNL